MEGSKGCPIGEELASDACIYEIALGFKMAKLLHEANGVDLLYINKLKDLGIWGEDDLLLQLESVYYENKAKRLKHERQKDRATHRPVRRGRF